jgi:RNase H-like domain found in reverse transcriptase
VLKTLQENQLKAKQSKCEFGVKSIEYLGHVISANGVATDPTKISAMTNWPLSTTLRALGGFLGLTGYYRKFIKDYELISRPLTNLLKKNAFKWCPEATIAFNNLKQAMCSAPVLALPDFSKPFVLETDASDLGIGAVLMQGKRPIAFLSKSLGIKNQHLSTYEKEFIALLTTVKRWRHYLQGMTFTIRIDHVSLKHLLEQRLTHTLQHKGLCKLLGLDYTIQYKRGVENKAADSLSRIPHSPDSGKLLAITELLPKWTEELKESYIQDEWAAEILSNAQSAIPLPPNITVHGGIIRKRTRMYVGCNNHWRGKIVQSLHDSSVGGH